jgi:amino acid transporter
MGSAQLVAADAAQILLGPIGVVLVGAAVAVSTFGTLNGSMMTAPRIFFALAEDGLFPKSVARVDPRTGAPTGAIALAALLGAVFVLVRTFAALADQFVIGIWPFYAMGVAAVFVLRRRRPDLERPYRTWGYPIVPALFLLGSVFLLGNYLVSQPLTFGIDVGLIAVGIPVYYAWRRFQTAKSA